MTPSISEADYFEDHRAFMDGAIRGFPACLSLCSKGTFIAAICTKVRQQVNLVRGIEKKNPQKPYSF